MTREEALANGEKRIELIREHIVELVVTQTPFVFSALSQKLRVPHNATRFLMIEAAERGVVIMGKLRARSNGWVYQFTIPGVGTTPWPDGLMLADPDPYWQREGKIHAMREAAAAAREEYVRGHLAQEFRGYGLHPQSSKCAPRDFFDKETMRALSGLDQ